MWIVSTSRQGLLMLIELPRVPDDHICIIILLWETPPPSCIPFGYNTWVASLRVIEVSYNSTNRVSPSLPRSYLSKVILRFLNWSLGIFGFVLFGLCLGFLVLLWLFFLSLSLINITFWICLENPFRMMFSIQFQPGQDSLPWTKQWE